MLSQNTRAQCIPGDAGTPGDDVIDCTVANAPVGNVHGEGGNDTINIDTGVTIPGVLSGDDPGGGVGTGNDVINNNGAANDIYGDSDAGDGFGNDIITNNGSAVDIMGDSYDGTGFGNDIVTNNGTANAMSGDSNDGDGAGDDVVVNNGTLIENILGDSNFGDGSGNDSLTNNGSADGIFGDSDTGLGSGSDSIVNNGIIAGNVSGDSNTAIGTGNDTITNNGTINGSLYGDSVAVTGTGSDNITNNGTVAGNVEAQGGNDTVVLGENGNVGGNINAADGDDFVSLAGGQLGGVADGGAGFDTLEFALSTSDETELQSWADQILAANPSGGTITLGSVTYTWTNFEELVQILSQIAINGNNGLLQVFCRFNGNLDVYRIINANDGVFVFALTPTQIATALAQNTNVVIGSDGELQLWALESGILQLNAPGYEFQFDYETTCMSLEGVNIGIISENSGNATGENLRLLIINRPFDVE